MTEYDAPHRTQTQILADHITQAAASIRNDWPHMLPKGGNQIAPGWANRSGIILENDHDPRDVDMRRIDRIVSLRRYAQDILSSWCRVIIEDRGVTNHVPAGTDVTGMATFLERHADWISGHESAEDCREEVRDIAHKIRVITVPHKREWMSIGECPLEQPLGPEAVLEECRGDVRVRLIPGQKPGEADGVCNRCGETAVASWWAERMFADGEASPLVTIAELVAVIAYRLEIVVTHDQIRQWKHRGKIQAAGSDNKGRTLYRHEEVIDSIRADVRARHAKKTSEQPA